MSNILKLKEIIERHAPALSETQEKYIRLYVEMEEYKKVAEECGVNESSVRRSIKGVLKHFNARASSVPQHMAEDVPEGMSVKGYSAYYGPEGERRGHWIKTDRDKQDVYNDLKESLTDLAAELPPQPQLPRKTDYVDPNLLTVYPLGDPHIGLLTYTPEVGADWDLSIAESVFLPLFHNLVTVAPPSRECLIIDLGDFWHYDGMEQRTMRSGHKVDADGRPSKMVQVGYRIMLQMIRSALDVHETVNVVILPGNHDDLGSIFLRVSLYHIFEDNPRVNVELSPNVFQYFSWGKNLLGMHHGDKCKLDALPMVMAADQKEAWGQSSFRHWLIGHFHHDSASRFDGKEQKGVKVETFRTIVANEGYAHEAGYRTDQDGKALVYHKDYGEIERYTVNISQIR